MNILIVDDDALVCQSLELLLGNEDDFTVVGTANNGREALVQIEKKAPDLVLMDIRMPEMDGIESTKEIKSRWPEMLIMMLTTFQDEQNIRLALQAGAEGYLLKSTAVANMAKQIRALSAGSSVLDADVLKQLVKPHADALAGLTKRESEIAECIAQGLSNKEIAAHLFLSVGTVRNTLSVILDKLELRDRTQLAIYYWKHQTNR
ncbi:response regulator transcription factor [Shouchella clausii]|jgi:two-component system, NarL family, response regulator LiaR|uniref:Two-component response regulator n=3 Tax=Shouchella TaxID=2893057 RepID=Q5WG45_SHOC1|nr:MULTISPECIES: response regulator transcription factor [Shouchella]MCM3312050.1 response regulator transcription factor [Psychrobacillus sp. MER TA 17]ALA54990.1 Two-component response regulator [Shouchella clausii]MBU3230966.1 response regulator transcription factor [Shouchella clausii]MBU3262959.1 response regulator transcription factor [Shouchella clausii]MBU3505424.1 response regulator transcription factor [Shouchella clausii]